MKKNVLVAINSAQQFDGCDEGEVNLVTCATLYRRQGKYYIAYDESELTGMVGTHTTVKIDGTSVLMMRTGTCPSQMLFIEGERHVGLYETGCSTMTISTYTSRVRNSMTDKGGVIALDYTTEIDSAVAGEHHIEMLVTLQEATGVR